MTKVFGPFFLVISSVTNASEHFVRVHRLFSQIVWGFWEHFLGPKRLLRTQVFEKKDKFSSEERTLAFFSRSNEHDKYQETIYKSLKSLLIFTEEVIRSIRWDLRCWKHKLLKKRQTFQWRKSFEPFCIGAPDMTNIREHIIRVHKVVW